MRMSLATSTARRGKVKSWILPRSGGRASMVRPTFRSVAMTVAAMVASFVALAPTPVYADTNNVEIVNVGSGLRADVMWASQEAFQGVFLWPNNTSASQEFDLLDSGGGFFRIRARHSGQCLMLDWRGFDVNGTRIIQYPHCAAGYAPAEWSIRWIGPPGGCMCFPTHKTLVNRATGRCLDAASAGMPGQEAVLQQWDCIPSTGLWNSWNQIWETPVIR